MEKFENIPEKYEGKKVHTSRNISQKIPTKNVLQLLPESISCPSGIEKTNDNSRIVENAIKKCQHKPEEFKTSFTNRILQPALVYMIYDM